MHFMWLFFFQVYLVSGKRGLFAAKVVSRPFYKEAEERVMGLGKECPFIINLINSFSTPVSWLINILCVQLT